MPAHACVGRPEQRESGSCAGSGQTSGPSHYGSRCSVRKRARTLKKKRIGGKRDSLNEKSKRPSKEPSRDEQYATEPMEESHASQTVLWSFADRCDVVAFVG